MVDQRVQPVGPDVLRHGPVTESGEVVATGAEPAVVQHVPLHADRRRSVSQLEQGCELVVEVHRFPHVEGHRTLGGRVLRAGTEPAVEPSGHLVEPVTVGAVKPGAGVAVTRAEHDLAGQEKLAAAEQLLTGERPFGVVGVVAAPADVDPPHLPAAEAEAGHAGVQHGGSVRPGAALAALPQVDAGGERPALRHSLAAPVPCEVEQFPRHRWHRVGHHQVVQLVAVRTGVRQCGLRPQEAAPGQLDPDQQLEAGYLVGGGDLEAAHAKGEQRRLLRARPHLAAVDPQPCRCELRGPGLTPTGAADAGPSDPAGVVLREEPDPQRFVHDVGDDRVHPGVRKGDDVRDGQFAEVRAPVDDRGQPAAAQVQHDGKVVRAQVNIGVQGFGHDSPLDEAGLR